MATVFFNLYVLVGSDIKQSHVDKHLGQAIEVVERSHMAGQKIQFVCNRAQGVGYNAASTVAYNRRSLAWTMDVLHNLDPLPWESGKWCREQPTDEQRRDRWTQIANACYDAFPPGFVLVIHGYQDEDTRLSAFVRAYFARRRSIQGRLHSDSMLGYRYVRPRDALSDWRRPHGWAQLQAKRTKKAKAKAEAPKVKVFKQVEGQLSLRSLVKRE